VFVGNLPTRGASIVAQTSSHKELRFLWCNLRKGPNLSGRDPLTGKVVRLFNPRRQRWQRHFEWMGFVLVGRTVIGRATVAVLDINGLQRVQLRIEFGEVGG
jgi:hypothetical protein